MRFRSAALAAVSVVVLFGAAPAPAKHFLPTARDVFYPLHLKFKVKYEIVWSAAAGDPQAPCQSWRLDSGTTTVVAQDNVWKRAGERKARRHGVPGSIKVFAKYSQGIGGWANGSAAGAAKGTVQRSWAQSGGANWVPECGSAEPAPFQATPSDCGGRTFKAARGALLIAQMRNHLGTLDDLMLVGESRAAVVPVISLTLAPGRPMYKSCMTSRFAPEFPSNLGIRLTEYAVSLLHRLEPGKTVSDRFKTSGDCGSDVPSDADCRYSLDANVQIQRWKPGEPFP